MCNKLYILNISFLEYRRKDDLVKLWCVFGSLFSFGGLFGFIFIVNFFYDVRLNLLVQVMLILYWGIREQEKVGFFVEYMEYIIRMEVFVDVLSE